MNPSQQEELNHSQDIAIIAMSGRFPGANNIEKFWQNIRDGVESITFLSDQELLDAGIKADLLNNPNYVRAGAVVSDIDMFDASFFGYNSKEAIEMDPQQRLFLECAWEALERGGYNPNVYQGSIGIYAGCSINSYLINNLDSNSDLGLRVYLKGGDKDYLATRVAYNLNLNGPAVTVQTACSTSLVAVHIACQSLLNGENDIVLAGGASIHVPQEPGYLYQEGLITSPDGHCRAFDAKSKGTVLGNGVGIVLLKRLEDAIEDEDYIYAVIKSSAINNDGSEKAGYTAPSVEGQAAVISESHAVAEIEAETISYIEAHGTGTQLGDPIEIAALTRAFQQSTQKRNFCAIGSVKTNIGHAVTASGVVGLIKTALALKHQQLPPSLHFEKPNPKIDFTNSPFYVNTNLSKWDSNGIPRRAGVSSFGVGGTNAHVVLEEAPFQIKTPNVLERTQHLLTLSAKQEKALDELVNQYVHFLEHDTESELADICHTANTGRVHFEHRLAIVCSNKEELKAKLLQKQAQEKVAGLFSRQLSSSSKSPKIAFLFTGQGSQYVNMGRQLYETQPTFRQAIDECDAILRHQLEQPLVEALYPETEDESAQSLIDQTAYTQPALFAIEYALFKLWQSWGIKPDVVMGHSVGEYVAATVAGVFSLEDGLKLIAHRGRLMQQLPSGSEMVAVNTSEAKVRSLMIPDEGKVALAAINGSESVVISGVSEAIKALSSQLELEGIKIKKLRVSHAFHSPLMKPMLGEFEKVANQVTYNQPRIPLISNLTGTQADEKIATSRYWVEHICQPVRFAEGMETLQQQGVKVFLEIGAQPNLLSMGRQCLLGASKVWLPSMRSSVNEWQQLLLSLGQLYVQGVEVDWSRFDRDYVRRKVVLPTYPFQRQRYWIDSSPYDGSRSKNINTLEKDSSYTINLIERGKTEVLAQQLEKIGDFSNSEVKLIPKILKSLVKQCQQELVKISSIDQNSSLDQNLVKHHQLSEKLRVISPQKCQRILVEYLQKQVRLILHLDPYHPLDVRQSILELGFDSLTVIELKSQLEIQLKVTIPASEIIQGPSILELVENLSQQITQNISLVKADSQNETKKIAEKKASWIAYHKIKPNSCIRLFCFHSWGSSASMYKEWSDKLIQDIEVFPVQLPGRQKRLKENTFTDFVALIKVLENILNPYLDRPFALYGHSMGALIAFELAHALEQQSKIKPLHLFLSGVQPPSDVSFLNNIKSLSQDQMLQDLLKISEIPEHILNNKPLLAELMNVFQADLKLLQSYSYLEKKPLSCPIYAFSGIDDPLTDSKKLSEWSKYTTNTFNLQMLPGNHMFLQHSQKPLLNIISQQIKDERLAIQKIICSPDYDSKMN